MGNVDNESYLINPFTIDGDGASVLDDGFSVTIDELGRPTLNIHISLICSEYLNEDYNLQMLVNKTFSTRIKDFIDSSLILRYSLQTGIKKVLTLKIKRIDSDHIIYQTVCEDICVHDNYNYSNFDNNDFSDYLYHIFCLSSYESNYALVTDLMGRYSLVLSKFLYLNGENYVTKTNIGKTGKRVFRKGNFTSPLRQRASFINQFIFLNYLCTNYDNNFLDQLVLVDEEEIEFNSNRKILLPKNSHKNN